MQIELTDHEIAIITTALNEYWRTVDMKLQNPETLGTIEKRLLEQSKELTLPLLMKFENF